MSIFDEKIAQISDDKYKDPHTAEYWNKYWLDRKQRDNLHWDYFAYFDFQMLEALQELPIKSILVVGNGIDQHVRWFEYAGFDCTALDISDVATDIAASYNFTDSDLEIKYYNQNNNQSTDCFWRVPYRSGGKLQFLTGDIRDDHTCNERYDLIICSKLLQLYCSNNSALNKIVDALIDRLTDNGKLLISVHNYIEARRLIEATLLAKGITVKEWSFASAPIKQAIIIFSTG